MKSFVIATFLASLCTAFAHEEAAASQPMRKRTNQMQHKSSSANARVLATEEYDPYLGIRHLQGPDEEAVVAAPAAVDGSLSLSNPATPAGGAPEAGGPEAGGPEAGGPGAAAAAPMSMQMSMATEGETEDKGIIETVGDKIAEITGQSSASTIGTTVSALAAAGAMMLL